MDGLSATSTSARIGSMVREKEEKRAQERKRNLHHLVAQFLRDQGHTDSLEVFCREAKLAPDIDVCDNVDLETILLEYSDYYFTKFSKYPRICKKVEQNSNGAQVVVSRKDKSSRPVIKQTRKVDEDGNYGTERVKTEQAFNISVKQLFPANDSFPNYNLEAGDMCFNNENRTLKSIGNLYPAGSEWKEFAEMLSKEIVLTDLNVHWEDVKGLDYCKDLLKEAAVYPIKYPHMFDEKLSPWKGILLYGPPGTGKTMLAKAVATECKATFFNITSSSLISKWRGESEKYVRVLSDLARFYSPSIIFLDEVDWTVGGDSSLKSEPSKRFRAELLARLDGLLSMDNANILLLSATNVPWELDTALLRRLEKRIYVDLPDEISRHEIVKTFINKDLVETLDFKQIIKNTKGYSCADLKLLCKEAWMMQLRPIWKRLELQNLPTKSYKNDKCINNLTYLWEAMKCIKPLSKNIQTKYHEWDKSFTLEF